MSQAEEALGELQRFVDSFTMDVGRVRAGLDDEGTTESGKVALVGALNYLLDRLDILPDHFKGLGFVDDAIVLRLAAAQAVADGAGARGLTQLAQDSAVVESLLGDLTAPLGKLVESLPGRSVRGRTAAQILADADTRAIFDADVTRAVQQAEAQTIDTGWMGAEGVVDELRKMVRAALKKGGFFD